MHLVAKTAQAALKEEPDLPLVTPRGMAAPPPARPAPRSEGDPSRPATIRIEASPRLLAERKRDLERELDRVQAASHASPAALMPQLNWMLVAQGLLLNAFVLLLVFGWNSPLPGTRILLAGLAVAGGGLAGLVYLALRGMQPTDTPREAVPGWFATHALHGSFIAGWAALSIYALFLPASANATDEARASSPASIAVPAATQGAPKTSNAARGNS